MKMTKIQRDAINAKKEVFRGYCIPWDHSLTNKFIQACAKRPDTNPEVILDIITYDLIVAKIEHKPVSYYLNLLRKHYPRADAIYEDVIIDICGQDGFEALRKNKCIEACGYLYGRKLYAV